MKRDKGRVVRIQSRQIGRGLDRGFDETVRLPVLEHRSAVLALQQKLNAAEPALHLADLGNGSHRVEALGVHAIDVFDLRDGEDQALFRFERSFAAFFGMELIAPWSSARVASAASLAPGSIATVS